MSDPLEAPAPVANPMEAAAAAALPTNGTTNGDSDKIKNLGKAYLSVPPGGVQVVLPMEEFAEDLDLRLGRANGNIYQRKKGVEGIEEGCHDGQVMVRLKKKRYIVIDYGIVPNEQDLQAAALTPHVTVPLGAGVTKCSAKVPSSSAPGAPLVPCKKVGVPVLLHDSEPDQPASLYMRSGLCFTCQRNLNEKRRTQRKRPADRKSTGSMPSPGPPGVYTPQQQHQIQAAAAAALGGGPHTPTTTNLPGMQTVRIGGIGSHTNLVGAGTTGRVNATPHHRVLMAVTNGHKKIKLAHTNQPLVLAPDAIILNGPPDNHSCKSVRAGHGFAEIGADLGVEVHTSLQTTNSLLQSVNTPDMIHQGIPPPTPDEISRTYDQAFYSLSKSLYLLVQWKTSWDQAIATALQQESAVQAVQQAVPTTAAAAAAAAMAQQNAVALQAASMANAAATAAIGGMIHGNPGSAPVGLAGVPMGQLPPAPVAPATPAPVPPEQQTLAQAVASAAAVAAVAQPEATAEQPKVEDLQAPPQAIDTSVEV